MQHELLSLHNNSVAGVMPTLIAGNDVELFSQQIDNLPFAFIAPLGANNHDVCHDVSLAFCLEHSASCDLWLGIRAERKLPHSKPQTFQRQGLAFTNLNEAASAES